MSDERWAAIAGYEGLYEVSSLGRVRTSCGAIRAARVENGYFRLSLSKQSVKKRVYVHILVAAAFIGPRPLGLQVAHNDGNKLNCDALNLRYDTPVGNNANKALHGTAQRRESHPRAILDETKVAIIRSSGLRQKDLAALFGVSPSTVQKAKCGINWPKETA